MERIQWCDEFNVGVKIIDEQHKRFVGILNNLSDSISGTKPDADEVYSVIIELIDYTSTHFVTEEELMKVYKWENYREHFKIHNRFVEKIGEYNKNYHHVSQAELEDIYLFLKSWLLNHISVEDRKLASFLNSEGLK
ncbi:MAG: hemerythrin family protein [Bacteriovoracaceae bacterium]|nr:hemerythrin family protein [Bacteriovoracaceae bacterium]